MLAERDAQVGEQPISFRVLSINFEERWFGWDGQRIHVDSVEVDIPVLNTEQPIVPRRPSWYWTFHLPVQALTSARDDSPLVSPSAPAQAGRRPT